jgi:hypothetical protein
MLAIAEFYNSNSYDAGQRGVAMGAHRRTGYSECCGEIISWRHHAGPSHVFSH